MVSLHGPIKYDGIYKCLIVTNRAENKPNNSSANSTANDNKILISFSFRMKRCVCGSNTHIKPNSNKCPFNNVPKSPIINIINNSQPNKLIGSSTFFHDNNY